MTIYEYLDHLESEIDAMKKNLLSLRSELPKAHRYTRGALFAYDQVIQFLRRERSMIHIYEMIEDASKDEEEVEFNCRGKK